MKLTGTNSSIGLIVLIASVHPNMNKPTTCSKIQMRSLTSPASHNALNPQGLALSCALPTWWLWRGGRTRSLSEHGRETPLRPWYFVLRRGRVGRCQVCQTQLRLNRISGLCLPNLLITRENRYPICRETAQAVLQWAATKRPLSLLESKQLYSWPRNTGQRKQAINRSSGLRWIETINPKGLRRRDKPLKRLTLIIRDKLCEFARSRQIAQRFALGR